MLRLKAILDCIYFGLVPYWVYEERSHYGDTVKDYFYHIKINARVAWAWITFKESQEMVYLAKQKARYIRQW